MGPWSVRSASRFVVVALGSLGRAFLALFVLILLIFFMSRISGDPVALFVGHDGSEEDIQRIRESYGLDRPLYEQVAIYVGNLAKGDLGKSIRSGTPVTELLAQRLPASLFLAAVTMFFVVVIGFPLGIVAALRQATAVDKAVSLFAGFGQAAPSFWVGIILIQVFAVGLGMFPASGSGTLRHALLPAFSMMLIVSAGVIRLVRSSMIESLSSDYVRYARAKGLKRSVIIRKYALRNALLSVTTYAGLYFALMISTAIVVEVVFAWPGIGRLIFNSILIRDFPVLQGVALLAAVIVLVVNQIVDLLYRLIDPRIRAGYARG